MAAAAKKKVKKYKHFVGKGPGLADEFVPAAFETFGGFSKESLALIDKIGNNARGEGIDPQQIVDGLTNEIAVAIQRGNAACFLACLQEAHAVVVDSASVSSSVPATVASEVL